MSKYKGMLDRVLKGQTTDWPTLAAEFAGIRKGEFKPNPDNPEGWDDLTDRKNPGMSRQLGIEVRRYIREVSKAFADKNYIVVDKNDTEGQAEHDAQEKRIMRKLEAKFDALEGTPVTSRGSSAADPLEGLDDFLAD